MVEASGPSMQLESKKNLSKGSEYGLGLTILTICFNYVMIYHLGYFQNLALVLDDHHNNFKKSPKLT